MEKESEDKLQQLFQELPKKHAFSREFGQFNGFWFHVDILRGILRFHQHFKDAHDSDIILATLPKSGTTWLKALIWSIVNRKNHPISESPLLHNNPHGLVPFLEIELYSRPEIPDITSIPDPRIFATHLLFQCLPNAILDESRCRVIYLCRNPLDVFTSWVHFMLQNGSFPQGPDQDQAVFVNEVFDAFCEGTSHYGPFWDHILGYWKASLNNPEKFLFLQYEDLIKDIDSSLEKMAEFLGCSFTKEEENEGIVQEIAKLCGLQNLKNLECNKNGETEHVRKNKHSSFFRKGEVGGWVGYLSPSMAERLQSLLRDKFAGSGLTMKIYQASSYQSNEMEQKFEDQLESLLQKLPKKHKFGREFAQYNGFWFLAANLRGMLRFREHFKETRDSDIILATMPKSGTTWLKALTWSIVNREKYPISESPLLYNNPHGLVPFLEAELYARPKIPDIESMPDPRIFATHVLYQCLPNTMLEGSSCKVIYICRNPLDVFTSWLHFLLQNDAFPQGLDRDQSMFVNEVFQAFCEDTFHYGPFWDHVLGYWQASLNNPEKVLFLKYEDLQTDINSSVRKIAEFLGYCFSKKEENEGLFEEIAKLCSFQNLKNLDCNKYGETQNHVFKSKNSSYFRKGKVGDWVDFLSPSMAERLQSLTQDKLAGSGLTLKMHCIN
ncbi:OLC1v1007929C1 [Oldenlandia corymbosa var. corymbosa]|uniref:OLC1v1007929C1 n=1 Tax=Oldenlandia corymbosa var. corymbosa TaxID=529605 RepID=A0AAV1DKG2_OLDCO|nr:OLC1v1007929C1 [Oldenlandia corymbosa var. corymbosa]